MKKLNLALLALVIALSLSFSPVYAMKDLKPVELSTPGTSGTLTLPEEAEHSPFITPLGTAVDPQSGKVVEGFAIIHPKKSFHHRPGHDGGPGGGPGNGGGGSSSCFAYLSNGAKWRTLEDWVMNATNTVGLSEQPVFNVIDAGVSKWEDAADGSVDGTQGANILGNGSATTTALVADTSSPDGLNEVYFGSIAEDGAIAVTIVWGIFSGPPFARELVEWDMIFDQDDFAWSLTGEAGKMDFDNIATHELGHAVGMGHPSDDCTEETMYRFGSEGETKKQSLHTGDIAGIDGLY